MVLKFPNRSSANPIEQTEYLALLQDGIKLEHRQAQRGRLLAAQKLQDMKDGVENVKKEDS